jgi:hypothetical protein
MQWMNMDKSKVMRHMHNASGGYTVWLWLTLPIGVLLAVASGTGVFVDDFYARETATLQAMTEGVDLFLLVGVLPLFVVSAILAWRGSLRAMMVWLGLLGILIYNYGFNTLFLVYVALCGCGLYAFIGGLAAVDLPSITARFSANTPRKSVSVFLVVVAALFYLVWFREIGVALLAGQVPLSVANWNVPTSAVHVIDMAIVLPGILIAAVWLWRGNALGYVLAGVMLVLILTMGIGLLAGGLWQLRVGVSVRTDVLVIFSIISIMALGLLVLYLREIQE